MLKPSRQPRRPRLHAGSHGHQLEALEPRKLLTSDAVLPGSLAAAGTSATMADQKFVTEAYNDLLGRTPDAGGLAYWIAKLAAGAPQSQIANDLTHSAEYYSTIIKPAYQNYLGRPADGGGIAFWISQLQSGTTDEQFEAKFIGSTEFYAHAGGSDKQWVDAMYVSLLGRPVDSQGEAYWTSKLASGVSRATVAYGFASSLERESKRVAADYLHYLNRPADPQGLGYWVSRLAHGVTEVAGFIGSPEYYAHATKSGIALSVRLADDTGASNNDGITSDPTIAGQIVDTTSIASLLAGFDGAAPSSYVNMLPSLSADDSLSLTPAQLASVYGGPLTDGPHTLHVSAVDVAGNTAGLDASFTLDTKPPAITLSGPADGQTTSANVNVTGQVTDAVSGVASLPVAVDNGLPVDVTVNPSGQFNFTTQFPLDGSADGPHVVHFVATDVAGNISPSTDYHFTLQSSKPAIVIDNNVGQTVNQDFAITGQTTNVGGGTLTLHAALDNGSFAVVALGADGKFNLPVSPNGLADGAHTVHFKLLGSDGSTATAIDYSFTLDTQAPTIIVNSPTSGSSSKTNITLTGSVADATSGVAALQAAVDGGSFANVTLDAQDHFSLPTTLAINGSSDGTHVIHLKATDKAGNVSPATNFSFTLDTVAPSVTVSSPAAGLTTNTNVVLTGSVGDAMTGVAGLTAAVDGGSFANITLDAQDHFSLPTTLALSGSADGAHVVHFKATDEAGNISPVSNFSFTLDTQAPAITVSSPVDNLVTGVNVTVAGKVTDATSGVATLQAAVDNGAFSAVTLDAQGHFSLPTSLALDGSADGPHTVHLKATDNAGNVSAVVDDHFTLDTRDPVVNVTSSISGISVNNNIAVSGKVTDSQADLTTLQVAVDGGAYSNLAFDPSGNFSLTTALALNGTADGPHTLHFKAADMAGNASAGTDFPFTLDTVAPTIAVSSPNSGVTTDTNIMLMGSVGDATSGVAGLQAAVDGGAYSAVTLNAQGQFSLPTSLALDGSADGSHTVHLKATDKAGNASAPTDFTLTLDTTAPTITISSPASGLTTSTNITLAGSVSDATSGVAGLQAAIDGGAYSAVTLNAQGQFSLPTSLALDGSADGVHMVHLKATDKAGNVSAATDFTLTLDTAAPTIAIASPASGQSVNQNVTIIGQATDAGSGLASLAVAVDAGIYTPVTVDGSGNFNYLTTFAVDGSADGPHTIRFQATDKAGNASATSDFTLTIDTIAPRVTSFDLSPGSQSGSPGSHTTDAARVTLVGQTEPGVQVTLVGTGLTALATGSGAFTFPNVTLTVGDNTLTAHATDAAGNTAAFALTVHYTPPSSGQTDPVIAWNQNALAAIRADASDPNTGSRALAMVQSAVFDALNAVESKPGRYVTIASPPNASAPAAIDQAAHNVLAHLYPAQQAAFDAELAGSLGDVADGQSKSDGILVGEQVAAAIIAMRANDGWNNYVDYTPASGPGVWQPTAPMFAEALEPQWATLTPWVMTSDSQFRPAGPPALTSQAWADALNQVQSLGAANSTTRTADQTQIARFWADNNGTSTPPGHWNEIADQVAQSEGNSLDENARLLAELDVALADAAIVAWDAKYAYNAWRPITAIQNANTAGNPSVTQDPSWTPLLVSPPFPEYVSGHSTFSGTAAGILDAVFGANTSFTAPSDALSSVTRSFTGFDAAAQEAGMSRIYAGIHFMFSNTDGLAAGQSLAQYVLSAFDTAKDIAPPTITFSGPKQGSANAQNVVVEGRVLDNLSGVASLSAALDDDSSMPVAFDAQGNFTFTTNLPLDGSAEGAHVIHFQAADFAGNLTSSTDFTFTLDALPPAITISAPSDGATLTAGDHLTGTVDPTGSTVIALSYTIDGGMTMPMIFDPSAGAFDEPLDLSRLGAGDHTLVVSAKDAAGNSTQVSEGFHLDAPIPLTVSSFTPTDMASDVGVTFRPKVYFSRPVDPATLTAGDFFATDSAGNILPATIVPASDGSFAWLLFTAPLPGASTITVHVDGSMIRAASDGALLDAAGNGTLGSLLTWSYSTVSLAGIPGTSISGTLADPGPDLKPGTGDDVAAGPDGVLMTADDVYKLPIENVKLYILGMESQTVYTDSQGHFELDNIPSGDVKLVIDGLTATNAPNGFYFPEMVMDLHILPGVTNTVTAAMETDPTKAQAMTTTGVYLPRLQTSLLKTVSDTAPTTVSVNAVSAPDLTDQQRQYLTLQVQPGSILGADGKPLANPTIGISTVSPDFVRDMLPPELRAQHQFEITIQAPGATVFTTPVQITFPNLQNAPPGTKVNIMSFDHTTGLVVVDGTGTVSADGLYVTSDPGSGIRAPGWHFVQVGTQAKSETPCTADQCVVISVQNGDDAYLGNVIMIDLKKALPEDANGVLATARNWRIKDGDLKNLNASTQGEFAVNASGMLIGSDDSNDLFVDTGVLYFIPSVLRSSTSETDLGKAPEAITVTFMADLYDANGKYTNTPDGILQIKVTPGSTPLSLDGTVGTNGDNERLDSYKVQQRLQYLGFPGYGQSYPTPSTPPNPGGKSISVNGVGEDELTVQAIRLFQAALARGNPFVNGNGVVGSVGPLTLGWLNAKNAPRWDEIQAVGGVTIKPSSHGGGPQEERFGTSWVIDIIDRAAKTRPLEINGISDYYGDTLPDIHPQSHKAGLDFDVNIDKVSVQRDMAAAQIAGRKSSPPDDPAAGDNSWYRAQLKPAEIKVVDDIEDVVQAAGSLYQNVKVGGRNGLITTVAGQVIDLTYPWIRKVLTVEGIKNVGNSGPHNTHFHVQISPPQDPPNDPTDRTVGSISTAPGFGTDPSIYYRFVLVNGFEVAGKTNASGMISAFLTPDVDYTLSLYQPSTNRSATYQGHTNASGAVTNLPMIILDQFGGVDSTGDGLPDIARYVIGLKIGVRSFAGDGIDDAVKLAEGLDPLDGRAFPTGIVASVPLGGSAQDVAVTGSTAYVAAGTGGLAIVDVSQFNKPIVDDQLALPGTAIGVAVLPELNLVAVASGSAGLEIVDVANPMSPTVQETVNVTANRVKFIDGFAYVASGSAVIKVDPVTGDILQQLDLGGGTITDLAGNSGALFTMDSNFVLQAIDLSGGQLSLRGQLTMPVGGQNIFLGDGIIYAAASDFRNQGGFATADVSDLDHLSFLGYVYPADRRSGTSIALNGNGLALVAGTQVNGTAFASPRLYVMDVRDPTQTDSVVLAIDLPNAASGLGDFVNDPFAPRAVAVASGIAFVADGSGGLQIVNYLPFDNLEQPPTVSISAPNADVDPNTPGIQVVEGSRVEFQATAGDDVQLRSVELLINGTVVATSLSYPWDLFANAPQFSTDNPSFITQLRATDTGGNSTLSQPLSVDLVSSGLPPEITSIAPADGGSRMEGTQSVRIRFADPLSPDTLTPDAIQLFDSSGNIHPVLHEALFDNGEQLDLIFQDLLADSYELTIHAAALADMLGTPFGDGDVISHFTLTDRAVVSADVVDIDPNTPGVQVYEGTTIPVHVAVARIAAVETIDLLANGVIVGHAVTSASSADFNVIAPNLADGAGAISVQARVTTPDGSTLVSNTAIFDLVRDTTPPSIVSIDPADGAAVLEGSQSITIQFSKPIAKPLATDAIELIDSSGASQLPTSDTFSDDDRVLQLQFTNLLADDYSLVVHSPLITDRPGNFLGDTDVVSHFTLTYRSTLTTAVADLDRATPGIQILEATEVPIHIAVLPGMNVPYIDLYANGVSVARRGGLSADFTVLAPVLSSGVNTLTVQAHITDSNGFTTVSNPIAFNLLEDTTPPSVVSIDPADGSSLLEGTQYVTIQFSKPLAKPLNTNAFELDDSSGSAHPAALVQILDDDQQVQLRYTNLLADDYQLILHAPLITDRPGNPLGTSDITSQFTLTYRAELSTSVSDVDPNTPGAQVYEGTTIPLTVSVPPSVSVQNINLLANGVVVASSATTPADFSVIAPNITPDSDTLVVQAQITDASGFTTLSPPIAFDILKAITPPHLSSIDPANGAVLNRPINSITLTFDKSIAESVTTVAFSLVEAGPDGTFGNADDVVEQITALQFSNDDTVLTLTTAPLASGNYQLEIDQTAITDRAGNPLGAGLLTTGFMIQNVLLVTNTADSGPGSLRDAINQANQAATSVDIVFFIPPTDPNYMQFDNSLIGGSEVGSAFVIQPQSALPALNNPNGGVTIDGRTQTLFGGDTNPFGPEIMLDGSILDPSGDSSGIVLESDNNALYGLDIVNFDGHFASSFSDSAGVAITGSDNTVAGNYIGIDPTGTMSRPNGNGVYISGGSGNLIGTSDVLGGAAERNVISGNENFGVWIEPGGFDSDFFEERVDGNDIGTDASGANPVGNGDAGVSISSDSLFFSYQTLVVEVGAPYDFLYGGFGVGNTIAFNGGAGVVVSGDDPNVSIERNTIYGNSGPGIETLNNNAQSVPVLTAAGFNGQTWVRGSLSGAPLTTYVLDFYASDGADPQNVQGQRYLDSFAVTTDDFGRANFSAPLFGTDIAGQFVPADTTVGEYVTATASDEFNGNTSAFSNAVIVQSFSSLEPNDTIAEAFYTGLSSATPGTYKNNGTIGNNLGDQGQDVDMFVVQLNAGDRLQVAIDTSSNSGLDSYLRLFDADGNELAANDNGPPPGGAVATDSYLDFTAPSDGMYYLGISGAGNDQYDPNIADSGAAGSTGVYDIAIALTNQG